MYSQAGREDFWGAQLSSKKKVAEWPIESDNEDDDSVEQSLFLHNICLGAGAKSGEVNIVSLTTIDSEDQEVTLPIAWVSTTMPQTSLRLPLKAPVRLELTQGSGPVAICGVQELVLEGPDDDDFEIEDDDEEETPELVTNPESPELKPVLKPVDKQASKKRKAPEPVKGAKKSKLVSDEAESDSDDDDDSPMDEDDLRAYLNKVKGSFNGQANGDDDDDEEDDEDYDDEDVDDEDEDDEEDDDEEDESEEEVVQPVKKPVLKATKSKAVPPPQVKAKAQTPKQDQKPKTPSQSASKDKKAQSDSKDKNAQSAKKDKNSQGKGTPAGTKKAAAPQMSITDLQEKLLKSPALPKKADKFNNYLKHTLKVDDATTQKQLWDFIQKKKGSAAK